MKKRIIVFLLLALFGFTAFAQDEVMFALSKNDNEYRYSLYFSNKMLGENTYTISIFDWYEKTMYIAEFESKNECIESYNMYAAIKRTWTEGKNSTNDWIIDEILSKMKSVPFTNPEAEVSVQNDNSWVAKVISSDVFSINTYK